MYEWSLGDLSLDRLTQLAELLALYLARGDLLLLEGDLGAGKTTFARALIRALTGNPDEEVPSPTFALAQSYETRRLTAHHFDLYRLSGAAEVAQIGLEEALDSGLVLIEWAGRAEGLLPADCLRVKLADASDPDTRTVSLVAEGTFAARLSHIEGVARFLGAHGWSEARIAHVAGDASRRAYARLTGAGGTCLLMDSPPLPISPPVKDGKPYWALAHLAPDVRAFLAVGAVLESYELSVPRVLGQEPAGGLLLVEDFGDRGFARAIGEGVPMRELYHRATDVLLEVSGHRPPSFLLPYSTEALLIEVRLLIDWYWPQVFGSPASPDVAASFERGWRRALAMLESLPAEWVLRDFHSPNLLWLPEREGLRRVGLIDFQDAVSGQAAYDLAALLQDARIDVPEEVERELLERYIAEREQRSSSFEPATFRRAYALLGAQRTTKILGIFVRLAVRDDKPGYLAHLPRIRRYLARNLADPALAELREWYERHLWELGSRHFPPPVK